MGYIYKISSNIDDRVYIGSTTNLTRRWTEHKRDLKNSNHHNKHLQRFVDKYGIESLIFSIVEELNEGLLIKEQEYIDKLDNLFNISTNATAPMLGKKHTEEALEKISNASKGENNPMYGRTRSKKVKEMISKKNKGREKTLNEKILRLTKLKNRKELLIEKDGNEYYCFSYSHAAKIIGVTHQSVESAIRRKTFKTKGYTLTPTERKYTEEFVLNNLDKFDDDVHPQKELVDMLKSL